MLESDVFDTLSPASPTNVSEDTKKLQEVEVEAEIDALLNGASDAENKAQSKSAKVMKSSRKKRKAQEKDPKTSTEQKVNSLLMTQESEPQKESSQMELTMEKDALPTALTALDKQEGANTGVEQKPQSTPSKKRSKAQKACSTTSSATELTVEKANGDQGQATGADKKVDDSSASSSCNASGAENSGSKQLTDEQAYFIALMAARGNEQLISRALKSASSRTEVLACPVDPSDRVGADMLEVEPGDVVVCEAIDGSGWGFGVIAAPIRLAGQRGCFRCSQMQPIRVEVARHPTGEEALIFTQAKWAEAEKLHANNMRQNRLKHKAIQNRVRIARSAWEARFPVR